jgi:hypothetical protein
MLSMMLETSLDTACSILNLIARPRTAADMATRLNYASKRCPTPLPDSLAAAAAGDDPRRWAGPRHKKLSHEAVCSLSS